MRRLSVLVMAGRGRARKVAFVPAKRGGRDVELWMIEPDPESGFEDGLYTMGMDDMDRPEFLCGAAEAVRALRAMKRRTA